MVQITSFVAVALAGIAAASPAPQGFSFAKWARDIAANPDGDHLSPEDAIASVQNGPALKARAPGDYTCMNIPNRRAWGPDAVWCTNYLAAKGNTQCGVDDAYSEFCTHGNAIIVGVIDSVVGHDTTPCQHVAEIVGGILDRCYADEQVQGVGYATGHMAINVVGVE